MTCLGRRLQRLRTAKGLSRRQLEEHAQVPHGIISRLESANRAYPSVPVAIRVARVLGVTLDYLCGMHMGDCKETPMHFRLRRSSGPLPDDPPTLEVTTLQALLTLVQDEGHPVILFLDRGLDDTGSIVEGPTLEIYDGYRE